MSAGDWGLKEILRLYVLPRENVFYSGLLSNVTFWHLLSSKYGWLVCILSSTLVRENEKMSFAGEMGG